MTKAQQKELARLLYCKGVCTHQGELANRVGVSEVTISKWKRDGKWEDERKSLMTTRSEQLRNLYDSLAALNDHIRDREDMNYPTSKEADTLSKITSAISNLETDLSLSEVVDVFMRFNEHVHKHVDLKTAKELAVLQDSYIKTFL